MRKTALAALLLMLMAGCAPSRSSVPPLTSSGESGQAITLRVENMGFNDVTLYAITTGSRDRIGRVGGRGRETFRIPFSVPRDFRVRIDVLAGGNYTTPGIPVTPGDIVELTVEEPLNRSYLRK